MYNSMTFYFSFMTADTKQSQAPTCIQITAKTFTAKAHLPGRFCAWNCPPVPLHSAQFEGTATRIVSKTIHHEHSSMQHKRKSFLI